MAHLLVAQTPLQKYLCDYIYMEIEADLSTTDQVPRRMRLVGLIAPSLVWAMLIPTIQDHQISVVSKQDVRGTDLYPQYAVEIRHRSVVPYRARGSRNRRDPNAKALLVKVQIGSEMSLLFDHINVALQTDAGQVVTVFLEQKLARTFVDPFGNCCLILGIVQRMIV